MEPTEVSTTTSTTIPTTTTNSTPLPLKSTNFDDDLQRGRNPGKRPQKRQFGSDWQRIYHEYTREITHKVTHKITSSKLRPRFQNPKCGRIRKIFNFSRINLLLPRLSVIVSFENLFDNQSKCPPARL